MSIVYTNKHGIPQSLADAIIRDEKFSVGTYSMTQLLAPPRIRRLIEQHDHIECDVSERLWAMIGKGVHEVLARNAPEGSTPEQQLVAEIDGVRLSGTIDIDEGEGNAIRDWKVTSTFAATAGGRGEWESQLNCYSWLLQTAMMAVAPSGKGFVAVRPRRPSALLVTMIFRDWSATRAAAAAKSGVNYPQSATQTIEVPQWELSTARDFVRERLRVHLEANRIVLPDLPTLCSDAERWHRPGEFAVMKAGRKTAMRVLSSYADAVAWAEHQGIGGLSIVERPGVDVRCSGYCAARIVCPHALSNQPNQPQETED